MEASIFTEAEREEKIIRILELDRLIRFAKDEIAQLKREQEWLREDLLL